MIVHCGLFNWIYKLFKKYTLCEISIQKNQIAIDMSPNLINMKGKLKIHSQQKNLVSPSIVSSLLLSLKEGLVSGG